MTMTRREALKGTTASLAAIAAGGAVAATVPAIAKTHLGAILPAADDEQLFALCEEMACLREAWNAADVAPDQSWLDVPEEDREPRQAECDRCRDRYWDLQWEICNTPANSVEGVLAKFRSFYQPDEEARVLAAEDVWDSLPIHYATSVFGDLLRLAGEAST